MKPLAFFSCIFGLLFTDAVLSQEVTKPVPALEDATLIYSESDVDSATDEVVTERLFFGSMRPVNWDIYYFAGPAVEPRRLTDDPGLDYDPALSPDGRWIVFTSERLGTPDLFAIDLNEPEAPLRLLIESDIMEDQATFSPDGQTLFFVSTRDGSADIYSIPFQPDRKQRIEDAVNLTNDPTGSFRPAISPDGRRLAFSSDRDHQPTSPMGQRGGDLYVMELDGNLIQRLTHTESGGWSGSPAWSKDSETVYFYRREKTRRDFGLWTVPSAGGNPQLVYKDSSAILSPAVGTDDRVYFNKGTAFSAAKGSPPQFAIWSVLPDGSGLKQESDTSSGYSSASYALHTGTMVAHGPGPADLVSPQSKLAVITGGAGPLVVPGAPWHRKLPDRRLELFPIRELIAVGVPSGDAMVRVLPPGPRVVISALDGGKERELVDFGGRSHLALTMNAVAVSPDGEWLIYMDGPIFGAPDAPVDLWKIKTDGTGAVNLTPDSPANDGFPSFSTDGSWLVFRSGRTGNFDIFRMDSDGGGVENLTDNPARDIFPVVSPHGNLIAFMSDRESDQSGLFELYLMSLEPDGSPGSVRRITHTGVQNAHPYFSPDGEWLVFNSAMGGLSDEEPLVQSFVFAPQMYGELYAYRIADGKLVRLTHDKWEDGFPSWVRDPDSKSKIKRKL